MRRDRFNVYGFWIFDDVIGLCTNPSIEKGNKVKVYSKKDDMVFAKFGRNKVSFHVTNLTKGYFVRPKNYYGDIK